MIAGKIIDTPLGWVSAAMRDGELLAVSLPASSREAARAQLPAGCDLGAAEPTLEAFAADLVRYLSGERVDLSRYPVDLSALPAFLRRALLAAERVPYGEVRTYKWLAEQAGNARAARAAGQAMHHNPAPLVIPCHRIVGSDGKLTGFGGGLDMKRRLLALEGVSIKAKGKSQKAKEKRPFSTFDF